MNNKIRNKQIKKQINSSPDTYVNPFIKGNIIFESDIESMLYVISGYDIQKAIEKYNKYTKG